MKKSSIGTPISGDQSPGYLSTSITQRQVTVSIGWGSIKQSVVGGTIAFSIASSGKHRVLDVKSPNHSWSSASCEISSSSLIVPLASIWTSVTQRQGTVSGWAAIVVAMGLVANRAAAKPTASLFMASPPYPGNGPRRGGWARHRGGREGFKHLTQPRGVRPMPIQCNTDPTWPVA